MSDLNELYQQMILDHGRHPKNFGTIESPDCYKEGYNPLCGDKLVVYIKMNQDIIEDIKFEGEGCAISVASASLMTEYLKGKSISVVQPLFDSFHKMVTNDVESHQVDMGKLSVLAGVSEYPTRVKCATLCWHTLLSAINGDDKPVSTE